MSVLLLVMGFLSRGEWPKGSSGHRVVASPAMVQQPACTVDPKSGQRGEEKHVTIAFFFIPDPILRALLEILQSNPEQLLMTTTISSRPEGISGMPVQYLPSGKSLLLRATLHIAPQAPEGPYDVLVRIAPRESEPLEIRCSQAFSVVPKGEGPECLDPSWSLPDGAATIQLPKMRVDRPGERIQGTVMVRDLRLPEHFQQMPLPFGTLLLILESDPPDVVAFDGQKPFLEHMVDPLSVRADGTYAFSFLLTGLRLGGFRLSLRWKWRLFTEGACAVAIDGVYLGCQIGGQLNAECVCATLRNMPAPGSWACRIHPIAFRAAWSLWGCPGPSPY